MERLCERLRSRKRSRRTLSRSFGIQALRPWPENAGLSGNEHSPWLTRVTCGLLQFSLRSDPMASIGTFPDPGSVVSRLSLFDNKKSRTSIEKGNRNAKRKKAKKLKPRSSPFPRMTACSTSHQTDMPPRQKQEAGSMPSQAASIDRGENG